MARRRVRGPARRAILSRPARGRWRHLPQRAPAGRRRPTTRSLGVLPGAPRGDARDRNDRARAEDRATGCRSTPSCGRPGWPDGSRPRSRRPCTVTLLACHAVPAAIGPRGLGRRRVLGADPGRRGEGLVDAVDVYVEDIAFTVDDLRRVAEAAGAAGLALRCHADQLGASARRRGGGRARGAQRRPPQPHRRRPASRRSAALGRPWPRSCPTSTFVPPGPATAGARAHRRRCGAWRWPRTSTRAPRPCLSMPEVVAMAASLYRMTPLDGVRRPRPSTRPGCWGCTTGSARWNRASAPTSSCSTRRDLAMIPYRPGHNPVVRDVDRRRGRPGAPPVSRAGRPPPRPPRPARPDRTSSIAASMSGLSLAVGVEGGDDLADRGDARQPVPGGRAEAARAGRAPGPRPAPRAPRPSRRSPRTPGRAGPRSCPC